MTQSADAPTSDCYTCGGTGQLDMADGAAEEGGESGEMEDCYDCEGQGRPLKWQAATRRSL